MSQITSSTGKAAAHAAPVAPAAESGETEAPRIHVEERRLKLDDFLKTAIKINGSDLHLQAGSIPMIRVDGRARFLDCPAATDEQMKEFVKHLINNDAGRLNTL